MDRHTWEIQEAQDVQKKPWTKIAVKSSFIKFYHMISLKTLADKKYLWRSQWMLFTILVSEWLNIDNSLNLQVLDDMIGKRTFDELLAKLSKFWLAKKLSLWNTKRYYLNPAVATRSPSIDVKLVNHFRKINKEQRGITKL